MQTDTALLDDARRMDRDALASIFDLYAPALYSYALRFCEDPLLADHIVGDVFAKLLDHLSAGNGPRSNIRSYLFETAYHIIVDHVRDSQRRAPIGAVKVTFHDQYASYLNTESQILFGDILQAIQNDLTEDQRHVIILRFFEGFSLKETAVILGKSVANIKVMQHRATQTLRSLVEQETALAVQQDPVPGFAI